MCVRRQQFPTNDIKNKIKEYAASLGIEKCGIAPYKDGCAAVFLFPYFCDIDDGNLSLYARAEDYHAIVNGLLSKICAFINSLSPSAAKGAYCDTGPHIDRQLAYLAGLGFYGKNRMLINDDFGSWFFIGWIECTLPLAADAPLQKHCFSCGRCVAACPGNALADGFCAEKCASHISQKKGTLTAEEEAILKKNPSVFGCDICQRVCPHNRGKAGAMAEFTKNLKRSISARELEPLSNREFMRKYKNRAFSWRGKNVLLRNLKLKNDFPEGIERK